MSVADFIYCESVLSKESCDSLVRYFEDNIELAIPGYMGHYHTPIGNLEIQLEVEDQSEYYGLGKSISKGVVSYSKIYPLVTTNMGRWTIVDTCQYAKFEAGKYYSHIHCENSMPVVPIANRCFAWMIYLNTIKDGGGTEFIHQNFTTNPIAGDMYIWPAGWTHMHRGVNAPNQDKYTITGWCYYV